MSEKELRRVEVLSRVAGGELLLSDAAEILHLSYRQTKRLGQRYRQQGPSERPDAARASSIVR